MNESLDNSLFVWGKGFVRKRVEPQLRVLKEKRIRIKTRLEVPLPQRKKKKKKLYFFPTS